MKSSLVLVFLLVGSLLGADKAPAPLGKDVVTLDAYKVTDRAIGSFTIAIRTMHNAEHKKTRIFIIEVQEDSDAERADLQVGDEIVKIIEKAGEAGLFDRRQS